MSGYCRLQMPLKLALAVRDTVAGHRLGALEGGGGGNLPPLPMQQCPPPSRSHSQRCQRASVASPRGCLWYLGYLGGGGVHIHVYVYVYTCPCARVNAVSGPFFREGGLWPPSQILSLRVYNMLTMSTISRPRLLVGHGVYRLYPGKLVCAQCLQNMHSVHKTIRIRVCAVYALHVRVRVYMYTRMRAYTYISGGGGGVGCTMGSCRDALDGGGGTPPPGRPAYAQPLSP